MNKTYYDKKKLLYVSRFSFEGRRYATYAPTKAEAEDKAWKMQAKLKEQGHIDNSKITLEQYYESWLEEQEKVVKPSTIYNYKKSWKHIKQILGRLKVKDINKTDVQRLQKKVAAISSACAANRCVRLLKQILNSAIIEEIITRNPCLAVKNLKADKQKAVDTNHRALTHEETKTFLESAERCHYYTLFKFLLATGCRIGEATALTWFDVNFTKREIKISKTVSRIADSEFIVSDSPKTDSSNRILPITSEVEKILQEQKERNNMLFGSRCMLVFPNNHGELANHNGVDNSIRLVIKKINKAAEKAAAETKTTYKPYQSISAHAFRDTFATRCIEQGMNPHTLKALMGHSSLKMTMDLYAHVMPNTKQEELEKISFAV